MYLKTDKHKINTHTHTHTDISILLIEDLLCVCVCVCHENGRTDRQSVATLGEAVAAKRLVYIYLYICNGVHLRMAEFCFGARKFDFEISCNCKKMRNPDETKSYAGRSNFFFLVRTTVHCT